MLLIIKRLKMCNGAELMFLTWCLVWSAFTVAHVVLHLLHSLFNFLLHSSFNAMVFFSSSSFIFLCHRRAPNEKLKVSEPNVLLPHDWPQLT